MMGDPAREFEVERVIVVLDSDLDADDAAVETAARLAARIDAEVAVVFIEDMNLFRLAALPVALAVSLPHATGAADAAAFELQLRLAARRAEQAAASAAARAGVAWSFRVLRGEIEHVLASAATAADLLVVATAQRLPGSRLRVRSLSPLARVVRRSRGSHLLVSGAAGRLHPVALVDADSPQAERVLAAACRLREGPPHGLDIVIGARDGDAAMVEERCRAWLEAHGEQARFRRARAGDVAALAAAIEASGGDLLVADAGSAFVEAIERAEAEGRRFERPLLVVR